MWNNKSGEERKQGSSWKSVPVISVQEVEVKGSDTQGHRSFEASLGSMRPLSPKLHKKRNSTCGVCPSLTPLPFQDTYEGSLYIVGTQTSAWFDEFSSFKYASLSLYPPPTSQDWSGDCVPFKHPSHYESQLQAVCKARAPAPPELHVHQVLPSQ